MAKEKVTLTPSPDRRNVTVSGPEGDIRGKIALGAPDSSGTVEFWLDLTEPGIAYAAVDALAAWAARQPGWTRLRTVIPDGERALERAVKRAGFVSSVDSRGNLCWDLKLAQNGYVLLFICVGLALGLVVGTLLGSTGYGAVIGIVAGAIPGVILLLRDRKKQKQK